MVGQPRHQPLQASQPALDLLGQHVHCHDQLEPPFVSVGQQVPLAQFHRPAQSIALSPSQFQGRHAKIAADNLQRFVTSPPRRQVPGVTSDIQDRSGDPSAAHQVVHRRRTVDDHRATVGMDPAQQHVVSHQVKERPFGAFGLRAAIDLGLRVHLVDFTKPGHQFGWAVPFQSLPPTGFFDRSQVDAPGLPEFGIQQQQVSPVGHWSEALEKTQQVRPVAGVQRVVQAMTKPPDHLAQAARPIVVEQPVSLADTPQ